MSGDLEGSIDYAKLKRHYDCYDAVSLVDPATGVALLNGIPFTNVQTYYVVGLMAYLNNVNVADVYKGWTLFTHGQQAPPAWLAPLLAILGIATFPAQVPAFEAKDILVFADQACWLRFDSPNNVPVFIPANTYMRFHTRCFMLWVTRFAIDGTLRVWIEG